MFAEFFHHLSGWTSLDTWIVITAALAAMACALPGNYLLLRRQSMMGDALSHTALLGIVSAFLFSYWLKSSGWISEERYFATQHAIMFGGAIVVGVLSSLLAEWIQQLGRLEASASLGVVYTTLFALGLLLIRVAADSVHIDLNCVFYGKLEPAVLETVGQTDIPQAALTNATILTVNGILVIAFFKELRISTFDPSLSSSMGINARLMNYALMGMTAATLVAAFESVGSILVIAMMIVPAATAHLLTDRLGVMIVLSLVFAALSAVIGHVSAITLPAILFGPLGFPSDQVAGTAGMMATAAGCLFVLAVLFSPRYGMASKAIQRSRLTIRIAAEDMLGLLYRLEEAQLQSEMQRAPRMVASALGLGSMMTRLAIWSLSRSGRIVADDSGYRLTDTGRETARTLVRSHRLWESYLARHFRLPGDHLHEAAARVEHYLNPELREELAAELDRPDQDPHGRDIPSE